MIHIGYPVTPLERILWPASKLHALFPPILLSIACLPTWKHYRRIPVGSRTLLLLVSRSQSLCNRSTKAFFARIQLDGHVDICRSIHISYVVTKLSAVQLLLLDYPRERTTRDRTHRETPCFIWRIDRAESVAQRVPGPVTRKLFTSSRSSSLNVTFADVSQPRGSRLVRRVYSRHARGRLPPNRRKSVSFQFVVANFFFSFGVRGWVTFTTSLVNSVASSSSSRGLTSLSVRFSSSKPETDLPLFRLRKVGLGVDATRRG